VPIHTVQSRDTLRGIADTFGTSVEAILEANPYISPDNPYVNPDLMHAGMMIYVPTSTNAPVPPIQIWVTGVGETLGDIAARCGTTIDAIEQLNGIEDPDLILPDQILCVPGALEVMPIYQVQPGDTLTTIAERFGSSVEVIIMFNEIYSPDDIVEGQILQIPMRRF
jgi:LysM repeat protein